MVDITNQPGGTRTSQQSSPTKHYRAVCSVVCRAALRTPNTHTESLFKLERTEKKEAFNRRSKLKQNHPIFKTQRKTTNSD